HSFRSLFFPVAAVYDRRKPANWVYARANSILGSAHVSRVGDDVASPRTFREDCFGETPKPTRETCALPGIRISSTSCLRSPESETRVLPYWFGKFGGTPMTARKLIQQSAGPLGETSQIRRQISR